MFLAQKKNSVSELKPFFLRNLTTMYGLKKTPRDKGIKNPPFYKSAGKCDTWISYQTFICVSCKKTSHFFCGLRILEEDTYLNGGMSELKSEGFG